MELQGFSQDKKKFIPFGEMLIEIANDERKNLSKLSEYGYIPYDKDIHPRLFGIPGPWSMHTIISVSTIMVNPLYGVLSNKIVMSKNLREAGWKLDCIPLLRVMVEHTADEYMVLYITSSLDDNLGINGTATCQSLMGGSVNIVYKSLNSDEREMKIIKDLATAMRHDLDLSQALTI